MSPSAPSVRRPRLPMWAKWVLSFAAGAILLAALIIFVDQHNTDAPPSQNLAAQTRANREAEVVVQRDQSPRVIRLGAGLSPRTGMTRTVRATMSGLIDKGTVEGPLQHVRCTPHGHGNRVGLSCVATANDVNYDFVGVADVSARRLTYCKRDEPPVPTMTIPLSPRCQS